jgi:uncharacterized protein YggE
MTGAARKLAGALPSPPRFFLQPEPRSRYLPVVSRLPPSGAGDGEAPLPRPVLHIIVERRPVVTKPLSALLLLLATGLTARAEITVNGHGEVSAVPDMAHVFAGVLTDGKTAADALDANNKAMRALLDRLKALGIDPRDVQTASFNLAPKYRYPKDAAPELIGYTVNHQLSITVQKLDQAGVVMDDLVKDGANQVNGVTFAVKDTQKLLDEARKLAIADARRKAEIYAAGAGVKLGKVLRISEAEVGYPVPRMLSREEFAKGAVPLAAGELKLSINMTAAWEIGAEHAS